MAERHRPRSMPGKLIGALGLTFACAVGCSSAVARRAPHPAGAPEASRAPGRPISGAAEAPGVESRNTGATPPALAAPRATPTEGAQGIGTPHPVLVRAGAPDRSWVVYCQAREDSNGDGRISVEVGPYGELVGDELALYFSSPRGEVRIDDWLGQEPGGRYVALKHAGRVWLENTRTGVRVDLTAKGADDRDDLAPYFEHRAVRFSSRGHALFFRTLNGLDKLVLYDLDRQTEREIDFGSGLLWRAEFDPDGDQVIAQLVNTDSNKNQRLEWPFAERQSGSRGCPGPIPSFSVWEFPGDRPTPHVVSLESGVPNEAPGFIATFGKGWLSREVGGELVANRTDGSRQSLASARCNARVLHSDSARQRVVVACMGAKGGPRIELLSPGSRLPLDLPISPFETDTELPDRPRLLPLYPKEKTAILDLDSQRVYGLNDGDQVSATHEDRALIRRNDHLLYWRVNHTVPLGLGPKAQIEAEPFGRVLRQGSLVYAPPWVVDLSQGKVLGPVDGTGLLLALDGSVLVASREPEMPHQLPHGPLRWRTPVSSPPASSLEKPVIPTLPVAEPSTADSERILPGEPPRE